MIAILYPLKMDKNLSETYSSIYEALHPTVARNDAINKEKAMKAAQERQVPQNVRDASKRQVTAGGPKDVGVNKYTTADKKTIINYNKNKMNNSYEPEGEMIDEKKAPRMQKGAMAYDGPNKERSEAADRVLAKTKKKMKKEESDYNYVNSYLSELSKKTMGSYIAKGSKDLADRRFDQGDSEKRKYEPDEADEKEDKKLDKREEGIARAAKKMAKEETINELESRTMLNYIDKASDSASKELKKAKKAEKKGKFEKATKARLKMDKRESGIEMAKDKIMKRIKKEGKFRSEWEEMKLNEINDYRSKFDEWLDNLVKEGYDIERWSDEELIDTFIDESNLWQSRGGVESALLESDKKGKGSGKKDACYKKVKASAKVWPSAYASGRLVQCRKKGAANYGNSKKEDFSNWRDELNYVPEGAVTGIIATGAAGNRIGKVGKLAVKNTGNKPAA